jgi:2-keto-4-pentenoate hydratase/2-oxohepta-3-ene-1,7-dioic acid hydratase in catechol pathway
MKWVRYEHEGTIRHGILEGGEIAEVDGSPFDAPRRTGRSVALERVRLLVPVVPTTFYCVGFNYAEHAGEFNTKARKIPTRPDVGYRAQSALIAHDEAIVIPAASTAGTVQYEGELVVVIGKRAKHVAKADALSVVFGYTIGNDVSERDWQKSDGTIWRAKNSDSFKPMGPWIETDVDLPSLTTRVRLNGQEMASFRTNDMIFGVADFIAEISRCITLQPGDVIWMGTESPNHDMHPGDVVEVEIDGIGVLRNRVEAEHLESTAPTT